MSTPVLPSPAIPDPPQPEGPDPSWEFFPLYTKVRDALYALPSRFSSKLNITEVIATDLFTFNSSLGATIETQVVEGLNVLRSLWDPDGVYAEYSFVRQAQRFPDVILKSTVPGAG